MVKDNIYWVVQVRTHVFATWRPVGLCTTYDVATYTRREFEKVKGKHNVKVDRVELLG